MIFVLHEPFLVIIMINTTIITWLSIVIRIALYYAHVVSEAYSFNTTSIYPTFSFYLWETLFYVDLQPDSIQQALRSTKSIS